jgi:hypothetical protein
MLDHQFQMALSILVGNASGKMDLPVMPGQQIATFTFVGALLESDFVPETTVVEALTGHPSNDMSSSSLLIWLYWLTRSWQTTDARDRIYGLLGLYEKICSVRGVDILPLPRDYQKEPHEIYTEVVALLLRGTRCLSLLNLLPDPAQRNTQRLPSWVLDFSSPGAEPFLIASVGVSPIEGVTFNASQAQPSASFPMSIDGSLLHLSLFKISTVSILGDIISEISELGRFEGCLNILLEMPAQYFTNDTRSDALWRTFNIDSKSIKPISLRAEFKSWISFCLARRRVLEHAWGDDAAELERYDHLLTNLDGVSRQDKALALPTRFEIESLLEESGLKKVSPDAVMLSLEKRTNATEFTRLLFSISPYRRVFLTSDKQLGLCPESTLPGDFVYIIAGARTPFILRKAFENGDDTKFELIGEAYVHGLMHGEVLEDSPAFEPLTLV